NGQPGCEESLDAFKAITGGLLAFGNRMACSHMRATELPIAERLLRDNTNHTPEQEECQWVGYQCKSYINFQEGLCSDCGNDGKKCKLIEYLPEFWLKPDNLVDVQQNYPQNLYMLTSGTPPYCVFHYMIELKMDDTVKYEGKIEFKLNGTQTVTFKRKFYAYPNTTTYNFLYTSQQHLGQITEIDIQYETTLIGDLVKASQILNPFTFLNEIKKEDINISNISVIFMSNIDKSVRDGYSSHLVPNPSKKSEGGLTRIDAFFETTDCLKRHCYKDVGCFQSGAFIRDMGKYVPHARPIINAMKDNKFRVVNNEFMICPVNPEHADVEFIMFTPEAVNNSIKFTYNPSNQSLLGSSFSPDRKTLFLVHGFIDGYKGCDDYGSCHWMSRIKDYFVRYNYNVVAIDWHKVGVSANYMYSAYNVRVVGAMVANFIRRIKAVYNYPLSKVEVMGHSLGGQMVGFVGKQFPGPEKIGLIMSLDPAGPGYDKVSIEPTDADFVVAVHTSTGFFKSVNVNSLFEVNPLESVQFSGVTGTERSVGHLDFWVNGGNGQPGCEKTTASFFHDMLFTGLMGAGNRVACSHMRATELPSAEGIAKAEHTRCQSVGYECNSYLDFQMGKCGDCGVDGGRCKLLEYMPSEWLLDDNRAKTMDKYPTNLYFLTDATAPYCVFHYQIVLDMAKLKYDGTLSVTLRGRKTIHFTINKPLAFQGRDRFTYLYTDVNHLGRITSATINFRKTALGTFIKGTVVLNPFTSVLGIMKPDIDIKAVNVNFMSNIDPEYCTKNIFIGTIADQFGPNDRYI
ncbi:unnamed protein product, partial [Medioppia subpectinata]